jgi:cytochrome P450 family 142 subfamily A polypeptide 1
MQAAIQGYDVNHPRPDPLADAQALAWLRRHDPVHWDAANGFWLLTRHADVRAVAKQPELFSSELKGPWHLWDLRFSLQSQDGPRHHRTRQLVSRGFTPRMVARSRGVARRCIDEAIDRVAARGSCEFASELAAPVPVRIIADMLGFEGADHDLFVRWSDALIGANHPVGVQADVAGLQAEVTAYVERVAAERERAPREDLMTALVEARRAGLLDFGSTEVLQGFSHDELTSFAQFLTVAGNETTRNAIGHGMHALLCHPDERRKLAAHPELLPRAADEILRYTSVVRVLRRTLARDAELGGKKLREGESVLMLYGSANRDEAVFDEPQRFRVDRSPNDHLAFGVGSHFCLGANLARMEIEVVIGRILERLPDLELAPGEAVVETPHPIIRWLERMPVVFTPVGRA